jgi:hypothetical protein
MAGSGSVVAGISRAVSDLLRARGDCLGPRGESVRGIARELGRAPSSPTQPHAARRRRVETNRPHALPGLALWGAPCSGFLRHPRKVDSAPCLLTRSRRTHRHDDDRTVKRRIAERTEYGRPRGRERPTLAPNGRVRRLAEGNSRCGRWMQGEPQPRERRTLGLADLA